MSSTVKKSEFAQYREDSKLKNWEIQRALHAGRTFFTITLRAAEDIAVGQVPGDRRRYTSPPQEDMVRILNWNNWLLKRFAIGGGRHGVEFLDKSIERWQEFLRYKGTKLGINTISEFGGVDVGKMEEAGQYRTSGIYSGWRAENGVFNQIYFRDGNGKMIRDEKRVLKPEDKLLRDTDGTPFMTIQGFRDRDDVKPRIDAIKDRIAQRLKAHPDNEPKDLVTPEDQEEYRNILLPVVNNLNVGLSTLLKNGDFGWQDNKLGYLLREEIWKKIANTNMPLMLDYLEGIKYEWDKITAKDGIDEKLARLKTKSDQTKFDRLEIGRLEQEKGKLQKLKAQAEKDRLVEAKSLKELQGEFARGWTDDNRWEEFTRKVMIGHERMIRDGMGEVLHPIADNDELNPAEKKLIAEIQKEGVKLAPHLADMVFPHTPFMNDVPFESFDYVQLGQTFYKRRSTNDLGGFNKGQQAYTKIMSNPGGIPLKEAVTAMGEIIAGVESPEGPRPAIEANFPTFSALLDVVTTDPGKRQAIFKMLLEATRTSTSLAQKWAGIKADSFTESEAANLIDDATRAGILNPELARYLKKNKHLTFSAILWMLFRDIFIVTVPIAIGTELYGAIKAK